MESDDARHGESKPKGLVNGHTHLYSGLVPLGMPAAQPTPANFLEILERVWWRLDRALDEASLRSSAELYVAESLLYNTAALFDHHESPAFIEGSLDVLAEVCESFGMPALLCYGVTERNGGEEEARRGLAENERFLKRCAGRGAGRVRGAVGVHASFTVSDETLRSAAELATEFSAPLHIHVAEDPVDQRDARKRGYKGVIDRLEQLGALQAGTLLAHGVHLSRDEVALASERGCWLVHNPRSNRGNRVGYPRHLAVATRVALGSDGYPSDMALENQTLACDSAEFGDHAEVEHAKGRLAAGSRLAQAALGSLAPPASPPDPARLAEIRENASRQAELLWERMAQL